MLPATRRLAENPLQMLREFDRFFGQPLAETEETTAAYPCDIRETSEAVIVEAELPGFSKDQIDVNVEQGILSIRAERKEESQPEGERHLHERFYTRVQRRFTLPTTVDPNDVEAHLDHGVLTLTLKKKEEVRPRRIEIQ
jgi:HSP20 family molecular chaperone IbpA